MSDIFKEVDEALKKEKVEAFWSRYGILVIALCIGIIIATGGYTYYHHQQSEQKSQQTSVLMDYMSAPEIFDSARLAALSPNMQSLGFLMRARVALEDENHDAAAGALESVYMDEGVEDNLRALAAYYARNMILNGTNGRDFTAISYPPGTIWEGHLQLQNALYSATRENDLSAAITALENVIADPTFDTSLKEQARRIKYVYEYDLSKTNS